MVDKERSVKGYELDMLTKQMDTQNKILNEIKDIIADKPDRRELQDLEDKMHAKYGLAVSSIKYLITGIISQNVLLVVTIGQYAI